MNFRCFNCNATENLYRAPMTEEMRERWLDLFPEGGPELFNHAFRICVEHFDHKFIMSNGELAARAVPTKFLVHNVWCEVEEECDETVLEDIPFINSNHIDMNIPSPMRIPSRPPDLLLNESPVRQTVPTLTPKYDRSPVETTGIQLIRTSQGNIMAASNRLQILMQNSTATQTKTIQPITITPVRQAQDNMQVIRPQQIISNQQGTETIFFTTAPAQSIGTPSISQITLAPGQIQLPAAQNIQISNLPGVVGIVNPMQTVASSAQLVSNSTKFVSSHIQSKNIAPTVFTAAPSANLNLNTTLVAPTTSNATPKAMPQKTPELLKFLPKIQSTPLSTIQSTKDRIAKATSLQQAFIESSTKLLQSRLAASSMVTSSQAASPATAKTQHPDASSKPTMSIASKTSQAADQITTKPHIVEVISIVPAAPKEAIAKPKYVINVTSNIPGTNTPATSEIEPNPPQNYSSMQHSDSLTTTRSLRRSTVVQTASIVRTPRRKQQPKPQSPSPPKKRKSLKVPVVLLKRQKLTTDTEKKTNRTAGSQRKSVSFAHSMSTTRRIVTFKDQTIRADVAITSSPLRGIKQQLLDLQPDISENEDNPTAEAMVKEEFSEVPSMAVLRELAEHLSKTADERKECPVTPVKLTPVVPASVSSNLSVESTQNTPQSKRNFITSRIKSTPKQTPKPKSVSIVNKQSGLHKLLPKPSADIQTLNNQTIRGNIMLPSHQVTKENVDKCSVSEQLKYYKNEFKTVKTHRITLIKELEQHTERFNKLKDFLDRLTETGLIMKREDTK